MYNRDMTYLKIASRCGRTDDTQALSLPTGFAEFPTKLLGVSGDAKTVKGEKYGVLTAIFYGHLRHQAVSICVLWLRSCVYRSAASTLLAGVL